MKIKIIVFLITIGLTNISFAQTVSPAPSSGVFIKAGQIEAEFTRHSIKAGEIEAQFGNGGKIHPGELKAIFNDNLA